jgi:hypothetical protein
VQEIKKREPGEEIPLSEIFANPDQPRKEFDPEKLEELAASIKNHGVIEPIVVTPRNGKYMIIVGDGALFPRRPQESRPGHYRRQRPVESRPCSRTSSGRT